MSTLIQQQIQDAIKQIVHIERVEEQLKITRAGLDKAKKDLARMDQQLEKELRDIEKLEGLSTKAVFYKILGSKEKQLEIERQEYLELSLKEEDLNKTIQLLEYEVNLLETKIDTGTDLRNELEKLKLLREGEIIQSDPLLRKKLLSFSNKIEEAYQLKNELEEAIKVGSVCHNLTHQIIAQLSNVRNWGQWPNRRSKRRMKRHMRRDAIDRARNLSYQINHHLNLFEKELADVGKQITFNPDTSRFSQFSDFFFNSLITDWILEQQLTQAIRSASTLRSHLANCVDELKLNNENTISKITDLNERRNELLLS